MCSRRGGMIDVEDVEPVEEIAAQLAARHGFVGVAVGGSEHAYVDILLGAGAEAAQLALLKDAQELGLGSNGHFAQLVQQERTAGGQLEASGAAFHGSGERAFFVAEQLALDERLWNCSAVDGDKGARFAGTEFVQGAGHELFAGAAFAGDQD